MRMVKVELGKETKEFPLGVSILLYGSVGSGKTTFSMTLAREFLSAQMPVIWICLDESPIKIREKMAFFKIDHKICEKDNLLRFIDIYSEQITGFQINDPYIINCSSAFNLNEVNRSLMSALSQVRGQGIVVFDSVSTLLLYNKSSTCEEFLKVHMSRINTAGFTGFFILQRDLHTPQTEETLKMMSDSVLEFGYAKNGRQIGVSKLPLGNDGQWIESSLFNWTQPAKMPDKAKNRKFMDSGGYIEDIREGVAEGVRGALESMHMGDALKDQNQQKPPSSIETNKDDQIGEDQMKYMNRFTSEMAKAFEKGLSHLKLEAPNLTQLNIDKFELSKLNEQIQGLVSKEASISSMARENELRHEQSIKKLDTLANKVHESSQDMIELDQRTKALMAVAQQKRKSLVREKERLAEISRNLEAAIQRRKSILERSDEILKKKAMLEEKIRGLIGGSEQLNIDLDPYLSNALKKAESQIETAKDSMGSLKKQIEATESEIGHIERQIVENSDRQKSINEELAMVQQKKARVESELALIGQARNETEQKLEEIAKSKRQLEMRLKALMEEKNE